MLEALGQAIQNFGQIQLWLALFLGIAIALTVGIIPAIGGMMMMAIFLPFCYYIPKEIALPFMLSLVAVSMTGGSITSILLNIPGTEANAATLLDGFPMTQKGQAGRALGASITASGASGIITVLLALIMIPLIMPMIMAITSADMVFVILVGIAFIAVLSKGSMVKGVISGISGLLLSMIGCQAATGLERFTFDSPYLYDGLNLVPVLMGLFALPATLALATQKSIISSATLVPIKGMHEVFEGAKDVFRHWTLWLRGSIIGFIVGAIPGIGPTTAIFIAYAQGKQTSKYPEKWGTGIVEGVIAPESSNNACVSGAALTTLALGIPGSTSMAILLGAFLIVGLTPGPRILIENLDLSLTLLLTIIVSNAIASTICLFLAPRLAKIATIPGRLLFAPVLIITLVGTFAFKGRFEDVLLATSFGIIGLLMQKWGYNRPALLLGLILGFYFEKYLFISLSGEGPLFFMRPISLCLIVLIIALFIYSPIKNLLKPKGKVREV